MKSIIKLLVIFIFINIYKVSFSQEDSKINTRIDNIGYWSLKAKEGLVPVNPYIEVPKPIFRTSYINSSIVLRANSHDIQLPGDGARTQHENSIFVDPDNISNLLNSNNTCDTLNPSDPLNTSAFYSFDQGINWDGTFSVGSSYADPVALIGNSGRYFVGFINGLLGQSIAFSDDNGEIWTEKVVAYHQGSSGSLDKNHSWIDNSTNSPRQGYIYDAWTDFGGPNNNQIMFSRSTDNGITWSSDTVISSGVNAGSFNHGVNICTGPNGNVYTVWAIYDTWGTTYDYCKESALGFTHSPNGGIWFYNAHRIIDNIKGIRNPTLNYTDNPTGKDMRVNSFPSMAVDISGGPYNGYIYVVWANVGEPGINTGDDIDIYLIKSNNHGISWSDPVRVNQDASGFGHVHFFPWISCDPVTGDLSVIFYDDRNVGGDQVEVFVAISQDAGNTWEDFRISDVAFTPTPVPGIIYGYMGDYLGISSRDGFVYPVWTDNRTGDALTYCSPFVIGCLDDIVLQNDTIEIGESVEYQANNSITVAGSSTYYVVEGNGSSGGDLTLIAGNIIQINEGFHSQKGSSFHSYIGECSSGAKKSSIENSGEMSYSPDTEECNFDQDLEQEIISAVIFPNPNKGQFFIEIKNQTRNIDEDQLLMITDLLGKIIYVERLNQQNLLNIDLSDAPTGIYLLRILNNQNILLTRKILIE